MRVAIAHYHLRPGGVTRVIENTCAALAAHSDIETTVVAEGFDYADEDAPEPEALAAMLHAAAPDADLWHVHNPALGKHRSLPDALALLDKPLLLQIHDFAEDGRPANLRVAERAKTLYPAAHYATVNTRDRGILTGAGLSPDRAHYLPNPVALEPDPPRPPGRDRPLVFYPVRGIPRKNLGELALLAAAAPEFDFAIAAAPENQEWVPHFLQWQSICLRLGLAVEFDVVRDGVPGKTFDDWYTAANSIVTTSTAEGFGLAFLEAFARGRPLLGRDLCDITRDFRDKGLRFGSLYDAITLRGQDFTELNPGAQQSVVEGLAGSDQQPLLVEHGGTSTPLREWVIQHIAGTPDDIAPNRDAIAKHYAPKRYAERLSQVYRRALDSPPPSPEIDRQRIASAFPSCETKTDTASFSHELLLRGVPLEVGTQVNRIRSLSSPQRPQPTGVTPQLEPLPEIRAVLFDIYGTLFVSGADSQPIAELADVIEQSHARSRAHGVPFPEVDIREMWREHLGVPDSLLESYAIKMECGANPVWPMPNLANTLLHLDGKDLTLGIISNAQFFTPLLFPALVGASPTFFGFDPELCLYSYQEGCAKPSPALFERAAERLAERQIEPTQTLYVGNDAAKDIAPAACVGFRTALFAGCARSYRPADSIVADLVLTDLAQLPAAIGV